MPISTVKTDILILGAGLTGLSTAYHLQQRKNISFLLLEKQPFYGGLCASTVKDGFTLDTGGHLLHLHTPYGKYLVNKLLKNNLLQLQRKAFIFTGNAKVPFPFQAHLFALPENIRRSCAQGLRHAPVILHPKTFQTWCLTHFGQGIYKHFLKPYNTKLWGLSPEKLTCEWCSSFIPRPTPDEITQSLTKPLDKAYGYNASFYYPKQGGIGALTNALAQPFADKIRLNTPVTYINLSRKTVTAGGQVFHFKKLINTLPLPEFVSLLGGQRNTLFKKYAKPLSAASVTIYHLAINRTVKPFSWIYFPEKEIPFFRVGLQSGFSPANAPKNTSLFYIELPGLKTPSAELEKQIWTGLLQKGIISETDVPVFSAWQTVKPAYVQYTFARQTNLPRLLDSLRKKDVFCAGRYGRWEYSFMESSLIQGKEVAEILTGSKEV